MIALPFLLAALAFLLFGLATDQHHGRRFRRPCPARRATAMRAAAVAALALGFLLSCAVWGAVFGPIGWSASVMSGAALAFVALNFVPLPRARSRRHEAPATSSAQPSSMSASSVSDPAL